MPWIPKVCWEVKVDCGKILGNLFPEESSNEKHSLVLLMYHLYVSAYYSAIVVSSFMDINMFFFKFRRSESASLLSDWAHSYFLTRAYALSFCLLRSRFRSSFSIKPLMLLMVTGSKRGDEDWFLKFNGCLIPKESLSVFGLHLNDLCVSRTTRCCSLVGFSTISSLSDWFSFLSESQTKVFACSLVCYRVDIFFGRLSDFTSSNNIA